MSTVFSEFVTGAVRSIDANGVAYSLISPIGLERLAEIARSGQIPQYPLDSALYEVNQYLYGDRSYDHLATACWYLMVKMEIEEFGQEELEEFLYSRGGCSYTRIPRVGLRRLAETYKEGEIKYSAFNCEKGFPILDLLNHCLKHIFEYGKGDEDDLAHASWNLIMAMHSEEMWPELNTPFLRGPGCTLTEEMHEEIDRVIREKKQKKNRTKAFDVAKRYDLSALSILLNSDKSNDSIVSSIYDAQLNDTEPYGEIIEMLKGA